nr:hypothetical protein CFP56_28510 [Quercus suber]
MWPVRKSYCGSEPASRSPSTVSDSTTTSFSGRTAIARSCCVTDNLRRGDHVLLALSLSIRGRLCHQTNITMAARMRVYDKGKKEQVERRNREKQMYVLHEKLLLSYTLSDTVFLGPIQYDGHQQDHACTLACLPEGQRKPSTVRK